MVGGSVDPQSGDPARSHDDWYADLWEDHAGAVWAYAARRVGREAAPDVVAETFLVAWRRGIRPDRDLPWLYGIARNVIRDDQRSAGRRDRLALRLTHHAHGSPQEDPLGPALALDALTSLGNDDREVLMLTAWDGLAGRDAATALGVSDATYRMRLTRARRRLERAMKTVSDVDAPEAKEGTR